MNQTHYQILKILFDENKISAVNGMKLKDLVDKNLHLTSNSVYKQLLQLNKKGYIDFGLRVGKQNSYYITKQGIEMKTMLEGGN
jgi:predicted transcriptional regulator